MADLTIKVKSDSADARKDLGGLAGTLDKLTVPAAAAAAAIGVMAADVINSASEAQQAAGALEAVFGSATAEMSTNAANAAQNVGLAESQYSQLAAVMGAQLGNMGIASDELASTTDGLIGVGADLAAQFGGSTADAVDALSSLMRGERDPIEKYGVSISQAAVNAKLAEMGLAGLEGEAAKTAQTQATLALLTEQTASAQGAFARETDTAAGAAQIASANWENAKATLGESLLPAVTAVTQVLSGMATWVQQNSTLVLVLVGIVGALAAGILLFNVAMAAKTAIVGTATAAQWLWNAAMSANPLGLIIIAVAAVVAGIVLLIANWDTVKNVALAVWDAISNAVGTAASWLKTQWDAAINAVIGWFTGLGDKASALWDTITTGVSAAADVLEATWDSAIQAVTGWFTGLGDSISGVVDNIIGWFRAIPDKIAGFFSNIRIPGWITDTLGFLGLSAPASELTMAYMPADRTFAANSPWSLPAAAIREVAAAGRGGDTLIRVEGALDPIAVAKQIRDILKRDDRRSGRVSVTGARPR